MTQLKNPLAIPPLLTGSTFQLTLSADSVQFVPGNKTRTLGLNQPLLAPTLVWNAGDSIQLNVTNSYSDTTTMHWHGAHVAAANDGGPHTPIAPGTTWSPSFTVRDEATTMWYHPHLHHHTAEQVYWGAAGMIIVRDAHENTLSLPRTYGVDDFPIIIQDKSFDSLTQQFIFEALSDTVMINGTLNPYLEVPAQMVRFRLLNGSNQRVYNLGFPPGVSWLIASDGGLLETPLPVTRVLIAPGERYEIVVDFSALVPTLPLVSFCSEMGPGVSGGPNGPNGGPGNPLDGVDFGLLEFRVVSPTANPITSLPAMLRSYSIPSAEDAAVQRVKQLTMDPSGFPFFINGLVYDMEHNNDTVWLGNTEIWELRNETTVAHPFHIHDVQFHLIELNGNTPPGHLRGRKDVVLLNPGDVATFITRFENFADHHTPYMYHCHNLFHEDGGMMGQFIVLGSEGHNHSGDPGENLSVFPNPTTGEFILYDANEEGKRASAVVIYDAAGKRLAEYEGGTAASPLVIDLSYRLPGMYLLRVEHESGEVSAVRVVKAN